MENGLKKYFKKLLIIVFILFPFYAKGVDWAFTVNPGGKFRTGLFFEDPVVYGCIHNDRMKALVCGKWYFNEAKVKGSKSYAYNKCQTDLFREGTKRYVGFARKINIESVADGGWYIECEDDGSKYP